MRWWSLAPRAPMAERNVQDPIPAYIKLVASKIHTKTSNVLREKIINYLALAKYTLALFLIRRCKNQATSKFSSRGMQSTHLISGVLVHGPKTNRREGGCALLCFVSALLYTSSLLCWLNCMLSRASKEVWMNHYSPQSQPRRHSEGHLLCLPHKE